MNSLGPYNFLKPKFYFSFSKRKFGSFKSILIILVIYFNAKNNISKSLLYDPKFLLQRSYKFTQISPVLTAAIKPYLNSIHIYI